MKLNIEEGRMMRYYIDFDVELEDTRIIDFDSEEGIESIDLVKNPCIGEKGKYFSAQEMQFKKIDKEMKVVGPFLIPNKWMIQEDDDKMPCLVMFTEAKCKQLFEKFCATKSSFASKYNHKDQELNAYISGRWIIEDKKFDKSNYYGFDLPINSCFMELQFLFNEQGIKEFEEFVMEDGYNSFSIKGLLDLVAYKDEMEFKSHPNCKCKRNRKGKLIVQDNACDFCKQKKYFSEIDNLTDDEVILLAKQMMG